MARRYGTNLSSLVSSSQAAYARQVALQDQIQAYTFDLSPKSIDDYNNYAKYLSDRVTKIQGVDPSKALSLQKTMTSANRSFTSAEVGRQSLAVLYGNEGNKQKYGAIKSLMNRAMENGDMNLAQTLENQLARLDVTIQNEATSAANAGAAASSKQQAAIKKAVNDQLTMNDRTMKDLELSFSKGEYTTAEFNSAKAKLVADKSNIYNQALTTNPDGSYKSGIDDQTAAELGAKAVSFQDSTDYKKYTGSPAKAMELGQNPYNIKFDPKTGSYETVDRTITGIRAGENTNQYGDNVDTGAVKDAFKKLGFDPAKININGASGKTTINGQEYDLYVNDPNDPTYAYILDTKTGMKSQITPEGKIAPVMSTEGGSEMPVMDTPTYSTKNSRGKVEAGGLINTTAQKKDLADAKSAATDFIAKARQLGYNDLADQAQANLGKLGAGMNILGVQFGGSVASTLQKQLNSLAGEVKAREDTRLQMINARSQNAALAALAAKPNLNVPTATPAGQGNNYKFDPVSGKVTNNFSPIIKVPQAVQDQYNKNLNTIGSDAFNKKYLGI